ncbi:MAG: hypothetical protein NZ455_05740 [Bacteroidia bacterium]|nr:hypothetical protein [Bacteroidia bacterium]MDW8346174.1 hypothetical protein [Bacteroidia bacterium]
MDITYSEQFPKHSDVEYIAAEGNWNHQPRLPKKLNPKDPKYAKILKEWGRYNELQLDDFEVSEVLEIDIDNDQVQETIIVANNMHAPIITEPNRFSAILMYKNNIPFEVASFHLSPESAKHCGLDNICYGAIYTLAMFLDYDGDGVLEIITDDKVNDGRGQSIRQWKGNKFNIVLSWGCGH